MFMGTFYVSYFYILYEKTHVKYRLEIGNPFGEEVLWIVQCYKRKKIRLLGNWTNFLI